MSTSFSYIKYNKEKKPEDFLTPSINFEKAQNCSHLFSTQDQKFLMTQNFGNFSQNGSNGWCLHNFQNIFWIYEKIRTSSQMGHFHTKTTIDIIKNGFVSSLSIETISFHSLYDFHICLQWSFFQNYPRLPKCYWWRHTGCCMVFEPQDSNFWIPWFILCLEWSWQDVRYLF